MAKRNDIELVDRILDCISDGYDDEEGRQDTGMELYGEIKKLGDGSFVLAALMRLCERIEDLED